MPDSSRILIVGGLGLVGAQLARQFGSTAEAWVTYRSLSPEREQWLKQQQGRVVGVPYDSARDESIKVTGDFAAIINVALPGAAESGRDPAGSQTAALRTAEACLQLLETGRAQRLIHFSSFHVYGPQSRPIYHESDAVNPQHPYGRNHQACEQRLLERGAGRRIFILRPTNIVGAPAHGDLREQARLLVLDLCQQAVKTGCLNLHNDGKSYRDFLPLTDALSAVRLLLTLEDHNLPVILNMAGSKAWSIAALAQEIRAATEMILGAAPPITWGTGHDAFREPFTVSTARLRGMGWQPQGGLRSEIGAALQFFAQQQ